ncbi:MAG TPA: hypothetical protein VGM81_03220 [Burkholderiaceae bacterium]
MQFPKSLHADDGWSDHMPAGHQVDIDMNPGELPSSRDNGLTRRNPLGPKRRSTLGRSTRPANIVMGGEPEVESTFTVTTPPPRRIKRSHASAWILGAAVCATGGALAVATMHEGHRNTTVAEVSNPTTDTAPGAAATTTTTAMAAAPEATAASAEASAPVVQEPPPAPAPVKLAQAAPAQKLSSDEPLPPIAPAAGRSAAKERVPAEPVARKLATLTSSSKAATDELVAQSTMPEQPLTPPPVQPPVTIAPPLNVEPPPLEVAPPPVQPPASGPQ